MRKKKTRPTKFESAYTIQPASNLPDQDHTAQKSKRETARGDQYEEMSTRANQCSSHSSTTA